MNYEEFFEDIKKWINECNEQAQKLGFFEQKFWDWAVESLSQICVKYHQDKLAQAQTKMLLDWLDQVWKDTKNGE